MLTRNLPGETEMYKAVERRDSTYEGVFFTAVRTTGIFCRPGCPAKTPRRENVEFFGSAHEALASGYRPCKRCRPLQPRGATPEWLEDLLEEVERNPTRRIRDADLRARSLDPARVRRWFQANHGLTFQAYQRSRRLGAALGHLRDGDDVLNSGLEAGYESASGFRAAFARLFDTTPARGRRARRMVVRRVTSPLGPLVSAATDEGLALLEFADRRMLETQVRRVQDRLRCRPALGANEHTKRIEDELARYFAGELRRFTVPLVTAGTPFQSAVWERLLAIPYGETISYERLAREIGRPGAQRAVGRANGDNRMAVVIPCHRVVRSDGTLCGYGGGLWRKKALLDLERGEPRS